VLLKEVLICFLIPEFFNGEVLLNAFENKQSVKNPGSIS